MKTNTADAAADPACHGGGSGIFSGALTCIATRRFPDMKSSPASVDMAARGVARRVYERANESQSVRKYVDSMIDDVIDGNTAIILSSNIFTRVIGADTISHKSGVV